MLTNVLFVFYLFIYMAECGADVLFVFYLFIYMAECGAGGGHL